MLRVPRVLRGDSAARIAVRHCAARGHLAPWLICAILGLLCYGMATRRAWARALGLAVGIASLPFWGAAILWGYAFSGFSSKSGEPTLISPLLWAIMPALILSIALIALLVRPLRGEERSRL